MATRISRPVLEILIVASLSFAVGRGLIFGDDFELTVTDQPELTSMARREGDTLTVTDATRRSHEYRRTPRLDSEDGRYLGFYSDDARQALRWPVSESGAMLLGGADGTNWRESRQQIRRIAAPTSTEAEMRGAGAVAALSTEPGVTLAAYIDDSGRIRAYRVSIDARTPVTWEAPPQFTPGGSLAWWRASPTSPAVLVTVDREGLLTQVTPNGQVTPMTGGKFLPGGDLDVFGPFVIAADHRGRLVRHHIKSGEDSILESRVDFLPPGAPIAVVQSGATDAPELYVVDRQGNLQGYRLSAASPALPELVATGFVPGSSVAVETHGDRPAANLRLAAVDWSGRLQLLTWANGNWSVSSPISTLLAPGSALAFSDTVSGALLMAVDPWGQWQSWVFGPPVIAPTVVAAGFPVGAPIVWDPNSGIAMAMDSLGYLAMSYSAGGEWVTHLASTDLDFLPKLVSREVVAKRPLDKARVTFENTSDDEIVLQIVDRLDPRDPPEFQIKANSSIEISFSRDSGATLQERYLAPGPGGTLLEETYDYVLPAQQRYDVVAWSNRVTYRYIDRRKDKPPGALPNFDVRNHVSLGVLAIPPGELLRDGAVINIQEAAQTLRNPGAAAWFPAPRPSRSPVTTEPPPETP